MRWGGAAGYNLTPTRRCWAHPNPGRKWVGSLTKGSKTRPDTREPHVRRTEVVGRGGGLAGRRYISHPANHLITISPRANQKTLGPPQPWPMLVKRREGFKTGLTP